jgi:hypothetical protein
MDEDNISIETHMISRVGVCWHSIVLIYYQRKFPPKGLDLSLLSLG